MTTQGHRVEDYDAFWASPAVWWKWDNDGDPRWMVRPPCGHHFMLAEPREGHAHHEVDEHDDGTISVQPKPGNSNSILCSCSWHGYIDHGVWTT